MSRYRLSPTVEQEVGLLEHCAHARFVWNLAVEQHSWWRPGRAAAPGYVEQARQLTEARAAFAWLRAGSVTVQQQALRDFGQAMRNFFGGTHRRPTWRKAGRNEGFRQVAVKPGQIQRLNRRWGGCGCRRSGGSVFAGRVECRTQSRRIGSPGTGQAGGIAFATVPDPIPAPGNNRVVGVDRGVVVSAALSTGELLSVPGLTPGEQHRLGRLRRALAHRKRGSNRRGRVRRAIARLTARVTDRRKDWVERPPPVWRAGLM